MAWSPARPCWRRTLHRLLRLPYLIESEAQQPNENLTHPHDLGQGKATDVKQETAHDAAELTARTDGGHCHGSGLRKLVCETPRNDEGARNQAQRGRHALRETSPQHDTDVLGAGDNHDGGFVQSVDALRRRRGRSP